MNYVLKAEGYLDVTCDDIFEMKIVSQYEEADDEYEGDLEEDPTELVFTVKDSKYAKLATLIENILYSAESQNIHVNLTHT